MKPLDTGQILALAAAGLGVAGTVALFFGSYADEPSPYAMCAGPDYEKDKAGRAVIAHQAAAVGWHRLSEFLGDLHARAGINDVIGAAIPLNKDQTAILGIHRSQQQTRFDEGDKVRLNRLIPHLRRAIQLTIRPENAGLDHQAALEGLERAHSATIVVDAHGVILFATRLAELLLKRGEGLRSVNGRRAGVERRAADRLSLLIRGAAGRSAGAAAPADCGGVAIEREDGRRALTVLVAPFRPRGGSFGAPAPAALVFIRDPETPSMTADILRDLFGLTGAQAAVAARLGAGESLEDIALALRITLHTARDHLKIVFAKTGCRRQSQLVALLNRGVAALGDGEAEGGVRRAV